MVDPITTTATMVLFFALFFIVIAALVIFLFIFWIFMLVDAATRNFKSETDKVVWVLVVVLTSWLGAIIYYFVIKRPNKR
jgi:hypothetical protein